MGFIMPTRGEAGQWRFIAAAAGVSGVLAVLSTLLAVGYLKQRNLQELAHQESLRAQQAAAEAREEANRGQRARDQAEELAGFLLDDLRDELNQLGRSDLLNAATERTVTYFDLLPPELVTPESQAKRASVLLTLSDARYQQGDYPGAIAAAQRSVELWKSLADGADPEGNHAIRLGRAMGELALYQYQSGDPYAARATYATMLDIYRDPARRIRDAGWRAHGVAKVHLGLGEIERLARNYSDARREYVETIKHISAALAHRPDELSWLQMLMTAHNDLGVVFMHEKNFPEAEKSLLSSVEINRRVIRLEPKNRRWEKELASTLQNLGALMHLQKDYARAEPLLREALTLRQGLVNWDPKSVRALRKLAHSHHRICLLQFDTGRNTNALASARAALATFRRLLVTDPDDQAAIGEIRDYAEKYRDRLLAVGMAAEAKEMIRDLTAFAEASQSSNSAGKAWEKLLAALREDSPGKPTSPP